MEELKVSLSLRADKLIEETQGMRASIIKAFKANKYKPKGKIMTVYQDDFFRMMHAFEKITVVYSLKTERERFIKIIRKYIKGIKAEQMIGDVNEYQA